MQQDKINKQFLQINKLEKDSKLETEMEIVKEMCGYAINELIPSKLNEHNKDRFFRVFHGYTRERYDDQIPKDIIESIVEFYPVICGNQINQSVW